MSKCRNRMLSIIVALAMTIVCFAAVTAVSFAEDDAAITVKVVNADQTETTAATYTEQQLSEKAADSAFYPYFYFGKGKATVLAAKGVTVADLINVEGVDMSEISGLKVCSGDFAPNNNQLPYLTSGVTYLKATVDAENKVVIEDEASQEVPFIIATEMYANGDNGQTLGEGTNVESVFNAMTAMINDKTATATKNRCAMGSLNTEDIAGNKFVSAPDTIKLYKGTKQELTVKGSKAVLKAKKLKKASQTVAAPVEVSGQIEGAEITYTKVKVSKKAAKFAVDSATGDITVKKGTKKGKYTVTVKAAASGDLTHLDTSKNVKVVITVK